MNLDADSFWPINAELNIPRGLRKRLCAVLEPQVAQNADATESLTSLLTQDYATVEEWLSLAQVGFSIKRPELAKVACDAAEQLGLATIEQWCIHAGMLALLDDLMKAEESFLQATAIQPRDALAFYRFGTFLLERGRHQETINLYSRLLGEGLDDINYKLLAQIYASWAVAKLGLGRNEEAIELLLILLSVDPEHRDFNYLMGLALQNLKEYEQAADFFRHALPQRAYRIDTILPLIECFRQIDRPDLAISVCEESMAKYSDHPDRESLVLNLAQLYFRIGDNERAVSMYNDMLSSNPESILARYLLLASLSVCGRPLVSKMKEISTLLWDLFRNGVSNDVPANHPSLSNQYLGYFSSRAVSSPLKVGILSSELGEHVVGYFLTPFLENYDRSHLTVELLSCREWNDSRGDYLCSLAHGTIRLAGLNEVEARNIIREQSYDIIVETSGYTNSPSLFILAERCAPVQCHYIGFHATTGLDTIDYFIGDHQILSESLTDDYAERPWRLTRPWLARSLSDGLPQVSPKSTHDGPVFGCFSSLQKLTNTTLSMWGEALQCVPHSVLVIKDRLTAVPMLRERILEYLGGFNVDSSRISFMGKTISWQEHMDAFNYIDIAFDTTPWSGATTAFDTLSMGVPLIGICGNSTSGRMSTSVLLEIGKQEWVASSKESFSMIAKKLADDYLVHRNGKQLLRNRVLASRLFDGVGLARELERAFEMMLIESREKAAFRSF
jgi:protein O-GlcNAc transferase